MDETESSLQGPSLQHCTIQHSSGLARPANSARPLPLASGHQPRAETEDEPRAPLIRCLVELVFSPAGPDFLLPCVPCRPCRFLSPAAWPSFPAPPRDLAGKFCFGAPDGTLANCRVSQTGWWDRPGGAWDCPACPAIGRDHPAIRPLSSRVGKAPRRTGWAAPTHQCRSNNGLLFSGYYIQYNTDYTITWLAVITAARTVE